MTQSSPISTPSPTKAPAPIRVPRPIDAPCMTEAFGPTDTAVGSGALIRRESLRDSTGGPNVRVSYVAGRVADTASVPAVFKEAMQVALRNWWRMEERSLGQTGEFQTPQLAFPKFALPDAARLALRAERRPKAMA